MSNPIIYIGCGGTGTKVLREFADLASEDPVLRYSARTELFFVLVDTEAAELDKSAEYIFKRIPGMDSDHVRKLHITQDDTRLAETISRTVIAKADTLDDKVFDRIKDHWWFYEDRKPFLAANVRDLAAGAGQCPPVAYFSAWSRFSTVTRELHSLLMYIERVRQGTKPLDKLGIQVITGLAGGTGRGCWFLLALEIQDTLFRQYKSHATVSGIFFDASVTLEKQNQQRSLENATKINSLTGYSELSYWLSLPEHPDDPYRLPSLTSPGNSDADEIGIDRLGPLQPVESAFLIFEDPGNSASLSKPEEYYAMAARALYCSSKYYQVKGELVNRGNKFQSFGAAAAQVPVARIRKYLEGALRVNFCENLARTDTSGRGAEAANRVMCDLRLANLTPSTSDWRWIFPGEGDSIWHKSVEQWIMRHEQPGGKLDALKSSLQAQDVGGSAKLVEEIAFLIPSHADARQAVDSAILAVRDTLKVAHPEIAELDAKGFLNWRIQNESRAFLSSEGAWPSLAGLLEFAKTLAKNVIGPQGAIGCLPATMEGSALLKRPQDLQDEFRKAKGRQFGIAGKPFNEQEIPILLALGRETLVVKAYELIRSALVEVFSDCFGQAAPPDSEKYLAAIREATTRLKADLEKDFDGNKYEKLHEEVFVDPDMPEKSLPKRLDETIHFTLREIKPHLSRSEVNDLLLGQIEKQKEAIQDLNQWIAQVCLGSNESKGPASFKDELLEKLGKTISIDHSVEEETFTLSKILPRIREDWERRFNTLKLGRDDFSLVKDRFKRFFGNNPEKQADGYYTLPCPGKEALGEFTRNFISSIVHCSSPFWRKAREKQDSDRYHYSVYLPDFGKSGNSDFAFDIGYWKKSIGSENAMVSLLGDGGSERGNNPYLICVMVSEGASSLNDIESLSYWREAGVIDLLQKSELPGHKNLIFQQVDMGINGVTYSSPIFVNNENFATPRWRPWHKGTAAS